MGSALEGHAEGTGGLAVRETAKGLAAALVSANTRRAYEGALRRLRDWLDGRTLDDGTLAEYLAARFEVGHSPAAAGQVVAAVRFYAKLGGQPSSVGPATERVLAGFRREGQGQGAGGGRPVGAGGRRGPQWRQVVEGPSGAYGTPPFSPSCPTACSGSPKPPRSRPRARTP